nr:unnamed protein product [Callosobruchus chinensis]
MFSFLEKYKIISECQNGFHQAFDTIHPRIIIEGKLYASGFRGIISFINECKFFVQINDSQSTPFTSDHGVLQGSTLGPSIFLLFINDMPQHVSGNNTILYADDTTVLVPADTLADLHQKLNMVAAEFSQFPCHQSG